MLKKCIKFISFKNYSFSNKRQLMYALFNFQAIPNIFLYRFHDLFIGHVVLRRTLLISQHRRQFSTSKHIRCLECINMSFDITSHRFVAKVYRFKFRYEVISSFAYATATDVSGIHWFLSTSIAIKLWHWCHCVKLELLHGAVGDLHGLVMWRVVLAQDVRCLPRQSCQSRSWYDGLCAVFIGIWCHIFI